MTELHKLAAIMVLKTSFPNPLLRAPQGWSYYFSVSSWKSMPPSTFELDLIGMDRYQTTFYLSMQSRFQLPLFFR